MAMISDIDSISGLPVELWRPILIEAKEPNASLACRLFQELYADPATLRATIEDDLKQRGIDPLLTGNAAAVEQLRRVKACLVSRLVTVASDDFLTKLKDSSPFSIFTYIRAFKEEEAIALCRLCAALLPQIKRVLTIDPQTFMDDLPKNPLDRARCIRTLLKDNHEQLKLIEEVSLKGLGLTVIPEELNLFTGLKRVDLSDNRLTALPASMGGSWTNLEKLSLNYNPVTTVRTGFGASWVNLKAFSLVKGHMTSLPEDFGATWAKIEEVDLNFGKLASLPQNFGINWQRVEKVFIDSNQLTDLPSNLSERWLELKFIRIRANPLEAARLQEILSGFENLLGAF
ncbi:leucine-rich repeat domain-containing protein [Estrella lausannensis]|uniref:Leucine-rich repeat-containing protein n=1 Tax=Estrella lausannensis TaxID=483423 RepID=A0A0H5E378_9BACT|nr:hypothetical protein [Estrella lausannensis]CRX37660.1 hypothetical protein ELAC_0299 [Estrella lausannensis]